MRRLDKSLDRIYRFILILAKIKSTMVSDRGMQSVREWKDCLIFENELRMGREREIGRAGEREGDRERENGK